MGACSLGNFQHNLCHSSSRETGPCFLNMPAAGADVADDGAGIGLLQDAA
jgi:hypothetical protein